MNHFLVFCFCLCSLLLISTQSCFGFSVSSQVTVSGLSRGAFFAVQYHVAYSSQVSGAAIIAGGPYWCANDLVGIALTSCMTTPSLISISELVSATAYAELLSSIDPTKYLSSDQVWLFSGTQDTIVYPGVMAKLNQYYGNYILSQNIQTVFDIPAGHSMVTNDYGNPCSAEESPYINNCNYSAVANFLPWIYPDIQFQGPTTANPNNIVTVGQSQFVPGGRPSTYSLNDNAYLYVPSSCQSGSQCQVHIAFHGCLQFVDAIGSIYYMNSGYNEWAESNNIIIVYPQATNSTLNPEGCWDWWGYTGANYCTQSAAQIETVNNLIAWLPTANFVDLKKAEMN